MIPDRRSEALRRQDMAVLVGDGGYVERLRISPAGLLRSR